jgi:hypothetical protein
MSDLLDTWQLHANTRDSDLAKALTPDFQALLDG